MIGKHVCVLSLVHSCIHYVSLAGISSQSFWRVDCSPCVGSGHGWATMTVVWWFVVYFNLLFISAKLSIFSTIILQSALKYCFLKDSKTWQIHKAVVRVGSNRAATTVYDPAGAYSTIVA